MSCSQTHTHTYRRTHRNEPRITECEGKGNTSESIIKHVIVRQEVGEQSRMTNMPNHKTNPHEKSSLK